MQKKYLGSVSNNSQKIKINDLLNHIPQGRKLTYLGKDFIEGISKYHEIFSTDDIDLNEILISEFPNIIYNKKLINDLKLFNKNLIDQITQDVIQIHSEQLSDNKLRDCLIDYYDLKLPETPTIEYKLQLNSECDTTLHDYQERIRRKVINLIYRNKKKFLIHMPTGAGKTRTAAEIIIDFIRLHSSFTLLNEKLKILWVAQSEELCIQAYETLKSIYNKKGTNNISFGHFYGHHNINPSILDDSAIIFTSIQKLLINYKTPIWEKIRNDNYLVVVDEAHRSIASQWIKALDYFVQNNAVNLIGLTATPGSGSKDESVKNYGLSKYYDNNKITLMDEYYSTIDKPIDYLVKRKFLAKIERNDIVSQTSISNGISDFQGGRFKFKKSTLKTLTKDPKRNASIINIIKEHVEKNEKILVFTCGLDHNKILKTILKYNDIVSEIIDQGTKNREAIISDFRDGNLNVLLNYGVLTTGFDAPKTNVCIIARPIDSIVMYSQMVGRILRGPYNGKGNSQNTLYTIKDNLNHGDYDDLFNSFNNFWR
ncbi:DEAD/DEAH box helicase [Zunongwangia sp. HGR-M22]|uniref:DEAD/DEAH box helicase n=1 Tax=Zunongwangia sp. HGR-M22 TaxID=3015168 RepID=UPI0022DE3BC9|nr:DEAD/DEAH box helicase family protein [Zunongwangia sp. HGR-M22]WBL25724.1 DEAD/DEAH box helicase family protein [Zunongwangia sp. HGR-M22]